MFDQYDQGGSGGGNQGGFLDNPLRAVRQQVEGQIGQAIDHYAGHVPGGHQFTPEAKQAVSGILDGLQRQLESQAASRLGGLGGAAFGGQGNSGYGGGQGSGGYGGGETRGSHISGSGNDQQGDPNGLL